MGRALAERQDTATDTEAEAQGETEDVATDVTDPRDEVQTDEGSAATEGNAPVEDEDDPHARELEAVREAAIEEGRERARAESEERRRTEQNTARRRQLRDSFPSTIRAIESELNTLGVTDPIARQAVINHVQSYNLTAEEAILAPFEDAVQELLPESVREAFNRDANGKDAATYLRLFAEHMAESGTALNTKAVKNLTLDEAMKASPKLKAEVAAAKRQSFDEGRAKGRNDPDGEPDIAGSGRAVGRRKTFEQLEEGYADGTNTKTEDAEFRRQREEKNRR